MPRKLQEEKDKKENLVKICYVFNGETIFLPPDTFPGKTMSSTYDNIDKWADYVLGNN